MAENLSNLIVAFFSLLGAIVASILIGLAIWTFRDIRSRSRDFLVQILATVVVAVIPIGGIIVYLLLRPRETLADQYVRALEEESLLATIEHQEFCPTCGRRVGDDMRFCPSCHTKLRNECRSCGRAVHLAWDLCPYCGTAQQPEMPVVSAPQRKQVAAPKPLPVQPARSQPAALPEDAAPPAPKPPPIRPARTQPAAAPEEDALPAPAQPARARPGFSMTGMLDKVGGAIEGAVSKVVPARPASNDTEPEAAPPPPPAARTAAPRPRPAPPVAPNGDDLE